MAGAALDIGDVEKETQKIEKQSDAQEDHQSVFTFGLVYVNDLARRVILEEKRPSFPVGSIIVREKLISQSDAKPQMLSVMIKREKGFDRAAGDWEFIVADSLEGKIQLRAKLINCLTCHGKQQDSDFVFRSYLPESVRLKL